MTGAAPEGVAERRRAYAGVFVGVVVLVLVAVPAGHAAVLALVGFTGCFLECAEPEPRSGVLWTAVALGLLALPVVVGALVARVPLRRAWPWLAGLGGVVVVAMALAQRAV